MQFAFVAAEEALKDSELSIESESDRIGIVMGTAMDGVTTVAQTQAAFDTGKRVGPRFVPMTIGNIACRRRSAAKRSHRRRHGYRVCDLFSSGYHRCCRSGSSFALIGQYMVTFLFTLMSPMMSKLTSWQQRATLRASFV